MGKRPAVHYVTYFDFTHCNLAAASIVSAVRTQNFARLTMVVPDYPADDPRASVFSGMIENLLGLDSRIESVPVGQIWEEGADDTVRRLLDRSAGTVMSPAHLFSDALRAQLLPWFGRPVLWFDVDMLFIRDVSDVFDLASRVSVAAAPDRISTLGDRRGMAIYQRFTEFANRQETGLMTDQLARNIGFMLLAADVRKEFTDGLKKALEFLSTESDPIASFSVGQLAWNYVFEKSESVTLDQGYNMPSACFPESWHTAPDGQSAEDVRVRHYVGVEQKKRMTLDFALEFAHHRSETVTAGRP
ncbi:hypothetical protein [Streptomyces avermitilis]|uniref:hypothetical protein n=1 Tax=Streptomyces avermitilis TaxID=33903 RepID=UPI0033A5BF64